MNTNGFLEQEPEVTNRTDETVEEENNSLSRERYEEITSSVPDGEMRIQLELYF